MADFSGLAALSGVENWAEKRQAKEADQQRLYVLNMMKQNELAQQQQSSAKVQEYLNTVGKIKVLDQDRQRIQAVDKELQTGIQEGIKKYQGNVKKYLESGGESELIKYQNNLLQNKDVERAMMNAINYNQYLTDKSMGLIPRMQGWTAGEQTKTGDFEDNYKDFLENKTKELNYMGAYARPEIGDLRKRYASVYGKDKFTSEPVNVPTLVNDVYIEAKGKGLSDQDAKDYAHRVAGEYVAGVQSGAEPYRYKTDDKPLHDARLLAIETQTALHAKKLANAASESPDFYKEIMNGAFALQQPLNVSVDAYHQLWGIPPSEQTIGQKTEIPTGFSPVHDKGVENGIAQLEGLTYDKKNNVYKGKLVNGNEARSFNDFAPLKDFNSEDYTVNKIEGIIHVPPPPNSPPNTPNQNFQVVDISMNNRDAEKAGLKKGYFLPLSGGEFKILVPAKHLPYEVQIFNNKYKGAAKQPLDVSESDYSDILGGYMDNQPTEE